jgi:hypothetical protein
MERRARKRHFVVLSCDASAVAVSLRASAFSSRCVESSESFLFKRMSREARAPGEVTEWPKVHDWKSCVPARVPRVRIPPSPLVPTEQRAARESTPSKRPLAAIA